jgi:hypothetical protein
METVLCLDVVTVSTVCILFGRTRLVEGGTGGEAPQANRNELHDILVAVELDRFQICLTKAFLSGIINTGREGYCSQCPNK